MMDFVRNMVRVVHVWCGILERSQLFYGTHYHLRSLFVDGIVTLNCLVMVVMMHFMRSSFFMWNIRETTFLEAVAIDIFHSFCLLTVVWPETELVYLLDSVALVCVFCINLKFSIEVLWWPEAFVFSLQTRLQAQAAGVPYSHPHHHVTSCVASLGSNMVQ